MGFALFANFEPMNERITLEGEETISKQAKILSKKKRKSLAILFTEWVRSHEIVTDTPVTDALQGILKKKVRGRSFEDVRSEALRLLSIVPTGQVNLLQAFASRFAELEDAFHYYTKSIVELDLFVTNNVKDFASVAGKPAEISANEFVEKFL